MIYHRCTKADCRKRVSLPRYYYQYIRFPKCPGCGRKHTLSYASNAKDHERTRRLTCRCGGIPWPHRRGLILDENRTCVHADEWHVHAFDALGAQEIHRNPPNPFEDDEDDTR